MKRKTNLLKFSLVALFLFISSTAWSATYYMCAGATLSLSTPVVAGITYTWDVKPAGGGTSLAGFPSTTPPSSLPTTGSYDVLLSATQSTPSGTVCPPDVVTNTFVVLPTLSMVLVDPTNPSYCAVGSTTNSSVIALTATPTMPAGTGSDLVFEYTYSVAYNNGTTTATLNGPDAGTIDPATGAYTLTATGPGTYTISGTVKYAAVTSPTGILLGTTGCAASTTATKVVTVLAAPTAPVITVTAN